MQNLEQNALVSGPGGCITNRPILFPGSRPRFWAALRIKTVPDWTLTLIPAAAVLLLLLLLLKNLIHHRFLNEHPLGLKCLLLGLGLGPLPFHVSEHLFL